MHEHTYEVEPEIIESEQPVDIRALAVLNEGEINQQIATAKKWPRSIKKFRDEALQLATLDEQTAAECIYALPRDGKVIEGPSARLAEIIDYAWGNTRSLSRVVAEDAEFVTSQGIYFDLERNRAVSCEVKRRITSKTGKRYSADMITVTSNAASSIAYRNCVFRGVPKALWKQIYDACRKTVAGDFKTLVTRRDNALQAFVIYGVSPDMIYRTLGLAGKEDIGLEHLVTLSGFLTALKEGDATVEDIFGNQESARKSAATGAATSQTASDIAEKYKNGNGQKPNPSQAPAEQTTAQPQAQTTEQGKYRDPESQSRPLPKSEGSQRKARSTEPVAPGIFGAGEGS